MNNAIIGAVRLLVKSFIGFLVGVALATVVFGLQFKLSSSQLTVLACLPFLSIYPAFVGILVGNLRDRAARDDARARQRATEARLASLLNMSPTILYAMEHDARGWRTVEITTNLQRLVGYSVEEALELHWWENHVHPDDYNQAKQAITRVLLGERVVCHYRINHKFDGYRWVKDELELVPATPEQPSRIIGAWLDITETQKAAAEIHRLAYFDNLTGLSNRDLLCERLAGSLTQARQTGVFGALVLINLDEFKTINDVHGHSIGDQVLISTARRLIDGLRASDAIARIGGDEFAVFWPALGPDQAQAVTRARALAKKLSDAIEKPIQVSGRQLRLTASIGISIFPNNSNLVDDILREADIAMYAAKSTTKSRAWSDDQANIAIFEVSMQDTLTRRHRIQTEIQSALVEHRFELWLQRQVDFNGTVIGAEALIRLRDHNGNIIFPDGFIPIAEECGLIVPVGQWVRTEACRLLACIDVAQLPRLSINVSAIEFRQNRFAESVLSTLARSGVDPSRIVLEITESLLIDRLDDTIAKLEALTRQGIRISIDDFGTGYSSLAYLQRLPLSEIKIDKSFVKDIVTDPHSARLAQSLIKLALNLGFDVVAEGVETREQAALLRQNGCLSMQGYLFGKPCLPSEFTEVSMIGKRMTSRVCGQ